MLSYKTGILNRIKQVCKIRIFKVWLLRDCDLKILFTSQQDFFTVDGFISLFPGRQINLSLCRLKVYLPEREIHLTVLRLSLQ